MQNRKRSSVFLIMRNGPLDSGCGELPIKRGLALCELGSNACAPGVVTQRPPAFTFVELQEQRAGLLEVVCDTRDTLPRLVARHRQRAAAAVVVPAIPIDGHSHDVV